MSDLICKKTMMRCHTPGMCSPHGGCQDGSFNPDWDRLSATQESLRDHMAIIAQLKTELEISDKLIAERNRLLDAIPVCPVHGQCVPYAIEWVEKTVTVMRELKAENEALRLDADRYRWLRDKDQFDPRFQHEALAIAFRDLTGGALDGVIDSIMRVDGAASDER